MNIASSYRGSVTQERCTFNLAGHLHCLSIKLLANCFFPGPVLFSAVEEPPLCRRRRSHVSAREAQRRAKWEVDGAVQRSGAGGNCRQNKTLGQTVLAVGKVLLNLGSYRCTCLKASFSERQPTSVGWRLRDYVRALSLSDVGDGGHPELVLPSRLKVLHSHPAHVRRTVKLGVRANVGLNSSGKTINSQKLKGKSWPCIRS
jgi:hypothetical protein